MFKTRGQYLIYRILYQICDISVRLHSAPVRDTKAYLERHIPLISVIIVNYNAGDWLTRCVESVMAQTLTDFECFIIDNGSADNSIAALPDLDDRFTVMELGENTGFAKGNNIGAAKASGKWIALLNPDAFARPDWLECLLAETARPNVTMVGSMQYMALEPGIWDGAGDCYHFTGLAWRAKFGHKIDDTPIETCEVFGPCAAAALYQRETFMRLGGFDERFFCYHEDVDLAYRMRLDGGICIQSADAKVDHVSSGISGRASDFAVYHGTRNRIWTFYKNTHTYDLIWAWPLFIALNLALLTWSRFRPGRFNPTYRGISDGFKGMGAFKDSRKTIQTTRKVRYGNLHRVIAVNPMKVVKRDLHSRPAPANSGGLPSAPQTD